MQESSGANDHNKSTEKRPRRQRPIAQTSVTLPIKRACDVYGLSYKTLRAAVLRGDLPIIRISRSWYVRRADVEAFLERHTETVIR